MTDFLFPDLDIKPRRQKRQESGLLPFAATYDNALTKSGSLSGPLLGSTEQESTVNNDSPRLGLTLKSGE